MPGILLRTAMRQTPASEPVLGSVGRHRPKDVAPLSCEEFNLDYLPEIKKKIIRFF
jgi:hypothetical protein